MSENKFEFNEIDTDTSKTPATNMLSEMREALSTNTEIESFRFTVPQRPDFSVEFTPDIDFDLLRQMMRAAARNKKQEFNPLDFGYSMVAKTNTAIFFKGNRAEDREGTPYTVAHAEFRDMMGAMTTRDAIKRLFVLEGHIIQAGQEIMDAAGYGDMGILAEEDADPLDR